MRACHSVCSSSYCRITDFKCCQMRYQPVATAVNSTGLCRDTVSFTTVPSVNTQPHLPAGGAVRCAALLCSQSECHRLHNTLHLPPLCTPACAFQVPSQALPGAIDMLKSAYDMPAAGWTPDQPFTTSGAAGSTATNTFATCHGGRWHSGCGCSRQHTRACVAASSRAAAPIIQHTTQRLMLWKQRGRHHHMARS